VNIYGDRTVDQELPGRLTRAFSKYPRVYFNFSGGKDSLVVAWSIERLVLDGLIDPSRVIVLFVDEEAIYPCVERVVLEWRDRFLRLGCRFEWLCLPFKHYSCFNMLFNDESFVLWERGKESVWVRPMPEFAVREHALFCPGDRYQQFLGRIMDGPKMIGLRATESRQRARAIARGVTARSRGTSEVYHLYPIYDWSTRDVWRFLLEHHVDIPDAYMNMWKAGVSQNHLRISQFFSIDTAPSLVSLMEFYPGLYDRVLAREPNAYLAMHYYDSSMFRRNTARRRQLERDQVVDWEARLLAELRDPDRAGTQEARGVTSLLIRFGARIRRMKSSDRQRVMRQLFQCVNAGDPKLRGLRGVMSTIGRIHDQDL
jgi:predicted phosphoadenosine phosphosulfate sulfurtransferase